jgi:YD repeat-containing protein
VSLPRGTGIQVKYDARLKITELQRGALLEKRAYDENGNLILIDRTVGAIGRYVERREFSQINFLKKLTVENVEVEGSSVNLVTTFTPDDANRVATVELPGGEMKTFTYDHLGNVVTVNLGSYQEAYTHDLHGNLLTVTKGGGLVSTFEYDGHDRMKAAKHEADGGQETVAITYHDNSERKSLKVIDPTHGVVLDEEVTSVDSLGRPVQVKRNGDSGSEIIDYSYPITGNGASIIANGARDTTTVSYDGAGRTMSMVNSLASISYQPDGNGNVE